MMILSLGLILVPVIPGAPLDTTLGTDLRDLWRDYYRDHPLTDATPKAQTD